MTRLRSTSNLSDLADPAQAREAIDVPDTAEVEAGLAARSVEIEADTYAIVYRYPDDVWTNIVPIATITGKPGADALPSRWFSAEGLPGMSLGRDSDYFLRADNGDIHQRVDGGWKVIANIKGADGDSEVYSFLAVVIEEGDNINTVAARYPDYADQIKTIYNAYFKTLLGEDPPPEVATQSITVTVSKTEQGATLSGARWHPITMRYRLVPPAEMNASIGEEYIKEGDILLLVHSIYTDSTRTQTVANAGDLYRNLGGAWTWLTNIMGKQGTLCAAGTRYGAPVEGTEGRDGDFYLSIGGSADGHLYRRVDGAWQFFMDINGAPGESMDDDLVLDAMEVGTSMIGRLRDPQASVAYGDEVDGALLMATDTEGAGDEAVTLTGIWVCLGYAQSQANAPAGVAGFGYATTLWMRVA